MAEKRKDNKGRVLRAGEGQRKDGKYYYRYEDINSERQTVYSWKLVETDKTPDGKKDDISLREKEKQILRDLEDGVKTYTKKVTLNSMFELYMDTKRLANSTEENYRYMWKRFVQNSFLGKMDVAQIKKSHILKFYKMQSDNDLSDGSIQILHKMIFPALQLATDDDLIRKNPAYSCCKEYTGTVQVKEALTEEEQRYFIELLNKTRLRSKQKYILLFKIMFGTACRIGEIMGLTWADIDMKNRLITVDHEVLYRKKNGKLQFYAESVKTKNGIRSIPMNDEVYECFRELRANRLKYISTITVDGYSNFVFTSERGKPLYPANINKTLKRIVNKNNLDDKGLLLPEISNHIMRHTGCTRMAEADIDPHTLQYIMGHGNFKMIMEKYDHVNIERAKKQMEKMNKVCAI